MKTTENFDPNENFIITHFDAERACDTFKISMTEFMSMVRDPENEGMKVQDLFQLAFDAKWTRMTEAAAETSAKLLLLERVAGEFGMVKFEGDWYKNRSALLKDHDVAPKSVALREYSGMSLQDAVKHCVENKRKGLTINGVEYDTRKDCLAALELQSSQIYGEMRKREMTFEQVVKEKVEGLHFFGYQFDNVGQASRLLGINRSKLSRLLSSYSDKKAGLLEAFRRRRIENMFCETWSHDGLWYACPWHACVAVGIDPIEFDTLVVLDEKSRFSGDIQQVFMELEADLDVDYRKKAQVTRQSGYYMFQALAGYEPTGEETLNFEKTVESSIDVFYDEILMRSLYLNRSFDYTLRELQDV